MDRQAIAERVASFDRWHYEFDLDGVKTPLDDPAERKRHRQRRRYFMDPLIQATGGSLAGKRVLDLACNAGYWSLAAVEAGAEFVHGVEGRQMHVDQANLVFEAKAVDPTRYRFDAGDVFTADLDGPYDVVMCLGLLYHVSRPIELFGRIGAVGSDLLVVDTAISRHPGAIFRLGYDIGENPRNALADSGVLIPSRRAVVEMAHQVGFAGSVLRCDIDDYTGMLDYQSGERRAFLFSKQTWLHAALFEPLTPPRTARSMMRGVLRRARGAAGRATRRR